MPRLYRPYIPLEVRCAVILRQLGEMWVGEFVDEQRGNYKKLLAQMLGQFARLAGCSVRDLRLDHDPPLAARPRRGRGRKTIYEPDANDHGHLLYRPHGPEFDGSHLIKTNVRGDHGQFPDRVLIKRERRRLKELAITTVSGSKLGVGKTLTWPNSSGFRKKPSQLKRGTEKRKVKWPSRPMPKGRKFNNRRNS